MNSQTKLSTHRTNPKISELTITEQVLYRAGAFTGIYLFTPSRWMRKLRLSHTAWHSENRNHWCSARARSAAPGRATPPRIESPPPSRASRAVTPPTPACWRLVRPLPQESWAEGGTPTSIHWAPGQIRSPWKPSCGASQPSGGRSRSRYPRRAWLGPSEPLSRALVSTMPSPGSHYPDRHSRGMNGRSPRTRH